MSVKIKVAVDRFLGDLLKSENVSGCDEVRLPVCQFLKRLGLVKLDVTSHSEEPDALNFDYTSTDQLFYLMMDDENSDDDDEEEGETQDGAEGDTEAHEIEGNTETH